MCFVLAATIPKSFVCCDRPVARYRETAPPSRENSLDNGPRGNSFCERGSFAKRFVFVCETLVWRTGSFASHFLFRRLFSAMFFEAGVLFAELFFAVCFSHFAKTQNQNFLCFPWQRPYPKPARSDLKPKSVAARIRTCEFPVFSLGIDHT